MSAPLTPPEHQHSAAIDECARYLAEVPPGERPTPLVPAMRAMFALTPVDVCEAIRQSHDLRRRLCQR